jgi:UDP-N-acetylglucosamine transferase subunit ALG13
MIFITVGAQMPFDRLVEAVDRWARRSHRDDVFAQIGTGSYTPSFIRYVRHLEPQAFRSTVEHADLIVAHAGMGSILTALEAGKPILVMPRRGELMETRNDHQVATAERLSACGRVNVAMDEQHLMERLERVGRIRAAEPIGPYASSRLLRALRTFIATGERAGAVTAASVEPEVGLAGAAEIELAVHGAASPILVNS